MFLDTDIVMLRDPLPYLFASGADSLGAMEKCQVHNASHALHSSEFLSLGRMPPPINIGVLYFRATAAVTRCVYNWAWEMHSEVHVRPQIWDQVGVGVWGLGSCLGSLQPIAGEGAAVARGYAGACAGECAMRVVWGSSKMDSASATAQACRMTFGRPSSQGVPRAMLVAFAGYLQQDHAALYGCARHPAARAGPTDLPVGLLPAVRLQVRG